MDLIRSGKAPEVICRKGAEGTLPLPEDDAIEVLTLLAASAEPKLREKALETLRGWDRAGFRRIMASPQTAPGVLRFAAEHFLAEREELREILLWNPALPAEIHELLRAKPAPQPAAVEIAELPPSQPGGESSPPTQVQEAAPETPAASEHSASERLAEEQMAVEIMAKLAAGAKLEEVADVQGEAPPEVTKNDDELTQKDRETLIEKISRMTVVEKIRAALTGNQETRFFLIRDPNKIVSRAVLQSPKISESEAESYASAKNVPEEVIRLVAANRKFMKTYVVARALVNNPRAPLDVTMPLIGRMHDKDLKGLSLNRNVPEVLRSMAMKAIKQKEDAAQQKFRWKR